MVDQPGRSAHEPEDRAPSPDGSEPVQPVPEAGWGSPVPAEYGSLQAERPPERGAEPAPVGGGLFSSWARSGPGATPPAEPWAGPGEAGPFRRSDPRPAPGPVNPGHSGPPARPGREDRSYPGEPTQAVPMAVTGSALDGSGVDGAGSDGYGRPGAGPGGPALAGPPRAGSELAGTGLGGAALAGGGAAGGLAGAGLAVPETAYNPDPLPPRPMPSPRAGRRPARARSRVVLRHVDVGTVVKVSVLFYLVVLVVIVVAAVLLWLAADAFGTLPSIEKSVRTLFSLRKFQLHPGPVALYTAAAGVLIAIVGTLANILLALIYNLIADTVGGVRVELESFSRE